MSRKRVACLGPRFTHSHLELTKQFPGAIEVACDGLSDCVQKIAEGDADYAYIPFHNTSALNIAASQLALLRHAGHVFVVGVSARYIRHAIGGFGTLSGIRIIRSIKPALHQIREWLARKGIAAVMDDSPPSTASALDTLFPDRPVDVAVVAARPAFEDRQVPIYEDNIQDEHNTTLFLLIGRQRPLFDAAREDVQALVARPGSEFQPDLNLVERLGLLITEAWILKEGDVTKAHFYSITSLRVGVDMEQAVKQFVKHVEGVLLGTYPGPTTVQLKLMRKEGYFGWSEP